MFFLKRILMIATCMLTPIGILSAYQHFKVVDEPEHNVEDKKDNFLDIFGTNNKQNIKNLEASKLYAKNLSSFVKDFLISFYKLFLYEWSEKQTTSNDEIKKEILAELEKLKNEKFVKGSLFDNMNEKNWKINELFSSLKQIFKDKALKNFLLKEDAGTIKALNENDIYAKFQKQLLEAWIAEENPFFLIEEKWNYSSTKPTIYSSEIKESSSSYKFPDFEENIESYKKLIENLKNNTFNSSNEKQKIFTKSDLTNSDDGYLTSGLVYIAEQISDKSKSKVVKPVITDASVKMLDLTNGTFKDEYEKKPIYLFLDKFDSNNNDQKCIYVNKNVFADAIKNKLQNNDNACVLSCIAKKYDSTNNKSVFFIRHLQGVSAFYESFSNDKFNKKIIDEIKDNFSTKKSKTAEKFLDFVNRNFERLLLEWLSQETDTSSLLENSASIKDLLNQKDLLKDIVAFSKISNQNKKYYQVLNNLTKTTASYASSKFEKDATSNKVYLEKSAGLVTPSFLEKKIDNTTEIKDIVLNKRTQEDEWKKNDGHFPLLTKFFDNMYANNSQNTDIHYDNLQATAKSLQIKIYSLNKNLLKNNYVFDSIYNKSFENIDKMNRYISNAKMANELKVNLLNNDFSEYLTIITNKLKTKLNITDNTKLTDEKLKNIILETFHLLYYQRESLDKRLVFGGYKKDDKNQILIKSSNYWTLKNYFFNDSGYDLSSVENSKFLTHLYFISWLLEDKNMNYIFNKLIPNNEFAALMWTDNINSDEHSSLSVKKENLITSLEHIDSKHFQHTDILFSPLFNKDTFNQQTEAYVTNLDFFPLSAIAYKENSSDKNLYGFSGLQTSANLYNFDNDSDQEINQYIKDTIFTNLEKSNPTENKNYIGTFTKDATQNDVVYGTGFGINSSTKTLNNDDESIDEIVNFFNSFSTTQQIVKFLQTHCRQLFAEITKTKNINDLNLDELKAEIKSKITLHKNLRKIFCRFAGVLQNYEAHQFSNEKHKYLLNKDAWNKTNGKIAFIQQVNKYDFTDNIESLSSTIDVETIIKTLYLLSHNEEVIKAVDKSIRN